MDPTARQPALLKPDNFTPQVRTPWGGTRIIGQYKDGLALERGARVVGESWEVSVEPSFPSMLIDGERVLSDVIAYEPEGWLGGEVAARYGGQTPLLVKLLDAADNLSVQVHPAADDPALEADESGKPESWIVIDADPGAGVYLGFKEGVDRARVREVLEQGGPVDALLNFVPATPGDCFVIRAGTPHAIGRGLTLVEPQFVLPGKKAVTYRFWDWNRLYDDAGVPSADGWPRELHVTRSMEVTAWEAPRGEAFVETCRSRPSVLSEGPITRRLLIDEPWFHVEEWSGQGRLEVPAVGTMWALTSLSGQAWVEAGEGSTGLRMGQSCVVPAAAGDLAIEGDDLRIIAVRSPTG